MLKSNMAATYIIHDNDVIWREGHGSSTIGYGGIGANTVGTCFYADEGRKAKLAKNRVKAV